MCIRTRDIHAWRGATACPAEEQPTNGRLYHAPSALGPRPAAGSRSCLRCRQDLRTMPRAVGGAMIGVCLPGNLCS
ncbi:hypothetical protein G6F46_015564 [Rhizopus delemar]|nr:hypothetical protein G6F46_015564 [Rhizopus delemar]